MANARLDEDRRRHDREAVPEWTVEIDGQAYPVVDWSDGGFLASGCTADYKEGQVLEVLFSVPAEPRFEFTCKAVVVRLDQEKHQLAAMFPS